MPIIPSRPEPERLDHRLLPPELCELRQPPAEAFLWGRVPPGPRIAIVGTRRPTSRGAEVARCVARHFARLGVCIVSGGALGIDQAAHEAALEVGGATLVAAPVWLEHAYPSANRPLFERIVERGGGYLCVAPRDAPPFRRWFHRRNEVLVALAQVLLVGEAGRGSGALNAAAYARALGRPRFVLPWVCDSPASLGQESELARGAIPYFRAAQLLPLLACRVYDNAVWTLERVELARSVALAEAQQPQTRRRATARSSGPSQLRIESGDAVEAPGSTDRAVLLAAILEAKAGNIDDLCTRTGLPASRVQHEVLLLTLEGLVSQDEVGRVTPTFFGQDGKP